MKKGFKKLAAIGLTCVMLMGMNITSSAAGRVVPPDHKCAYSKMGENMYKSYVLTYHPFYVSDEKGNTSVESCKVTVYCYREVWKCACGNIEYRNDRKVNQHSVCGR